MSVVEYLRECFEKTVINVNNSKDSKLKINKRNTDKIFKNIISAYSEPHRHYHNLNHIADCFEVINNGDAYLYYNNINDYEIDFALWFHDFIYNPKKKNNEQLSSSAAKELLGNFISDKSIKFITRTINATKIHNLPFNNNYDYFNNHKAAIVMDADLSILQSEYNKYLSYSLNIQKEYSHISKEDYINGRIKFLKDQITKDYIYFSFLAQRNFVARENMLNEYTELIKQI